MSYIACYLLYILYMTLGFVQLFLEFVERGAADTMTKLETAHSLEGIFCPLLPPTFFAKTRPIA